MGHECRFIDVNLDSSRRARRPRPQRGGRNQLRQMRESMRETVRVAILDAAEELIARHGLHSAALLQIAKRAGVAVGTLYNYFTDRDALIRGLFESRRATLRPRLLEAFEAHRSFLKVAIENEHLKPSGSTTPQALLTGVRDIIAAGVREDVIAPAHAELLPFLLTGTIKAIVVHRLQTTGELTADADAIVDILLAGVRRAR